MYAEIKMAVRDDVPERALTVVQEPQNDPFPRACRRLLWPIDTCILFGTAVSMPIMISLREEQRPTAKMQLMAKAWRRPGTSTIEASKAQRRYHLQGARVL